MRRAPSTALVTGASAGIGAEFARQLAARGNDLVLAARDEARMRALAGDLEAAHGIAVEVLRADLTTDDGVARLAARLDDRERPIDLLVNNAGVGLGGDFATLDIDVVSRQVRLNVLSVVQLTHAALGPMLERGHGAIVNVSSMAGYQPLPNHATYAASKAYLTSFTEAVREEVRGSGVHVMAMCPSFTHTEFHDRAGIGDARGIPEFLWQSAEHVVRVALQDLDRGRTTSIPGLHNRAIAMAGHTSPGPLASRVVGLIMRRSR